MVDKFNSFYIPKGRNKGTREQSFQLYKTLLTKRSFYEAIEEALLKTNQSVAFKILYDGRCEFEKSSASQQDLYVSLPESISWQRNYITEHLPDLIEMTIPNLHLMTILLSKKVFNKADIEYIASVVIAVHLWIPICIFLQKISLIVFLLIRVAKWSKLEYFMRLYKQE